MCRNFSGGAVKLGAGKDRRSTVRGQLCEHKSPQSVTKATGIFGLESFLQEHYTPSPQSAATIAAYLNGLERQSSGSVRARGAKHTSQANAPKPSPSETKEDKSPVTRALNSAADTAERTLNRLLEAIKPEKSN